MYSLSLSLSLLLPLVSAFNTYRSSLTDCLNDAQVPILLSTSIGWEDAIEPFNLRFTPIPNVVVIPRDVNDVSPIPFPLPSIVQISSTRLTNTHRSKEPCDVRASRIPR